MSITSVSFIYLRFSIFVNCFSVNVLLDYSIKQSFLLESKKACPKKHPALCVQGVENFVFLDIDEEWFEPVGMAN